MNTDTKARLWALAGTILLALLALFIFFTVKLVAAPEPPQQVEGSIALAEDFIEVIDQEPAPMLVGDDPAATHGDPAAEAQPTSPSGPDPVDAGDPGAPPPPVASPAPSPHKAQTPTEKPGPTQQQQKEQQDQRKTDNEVASAFGNAPGQHNTAHGSADQANSGSASSTNPEGSYTGTGTGSAGGGWGLPSYAPVKSTVTGMIKMKVTIDSQGHPTKVEIIGGTAPASTNAAARQACVAEVKSRTFTRPNAANAPPTAIAVITYAFK